MRCGAEIAEHSSVGLPRSYLVKSKTPATAVAVTAPAPFALAAPPMSIPFAPAAPSPFASFAPAAPSPFAPVNPFMSAPVTQMAAVAAVAVAVIAPEREAFRTKADSIEVEVGESTEHDGARPVYASAPSTNELLERAAALGPMRMTWESIVLPADSILNEKQQPHVAERRARLTRLVKGAVGACLGLCVLALGVSALSGDATAVPVAAAATLGKTVASKGIVPVERLDGAKHAKAARRVTPVATTVTMVRTKRR